MRRKYGTSKILRQGPAPPLYDINGQLALKVKGHVHKFCGVCGWRMQSCERGLQSHTNKQHGGGTGCWLKFGRRPSGFELIYMDWDRFM